MRKSFVLVVLFAVAAPAMAQQSYLGEVIAENVTVRSGPTEQMPDTGTLFRGTKVIVDHVEPNGWLAVEPPRGQISWVNHNYLDEPNDATPRNAVVQSDGEIEIAYGRPGLGEPLKVRRTKIADQTIVWVIGKKVEFNNSVWYPIEPPFNDFRYVPISAVRRVPGQSGTGYTVSSPAKVSPPPASLTTPVEARSAFEPAASLPNRPTPKAAKPADWPNHPFWQQAEQAERQSDFAKAESLYLKLAAEMNQPGGDAELANLCYARLHAVREKQRPGMKSAPLAGRNDLPPTVQWIGPGQVRVAGFKFDGKTTYALVGPKGDVKCYVLSSPEVDLERYRNTDVQIQGTLNYPGDLRGIGVMTASKIQVVRDR